MPVGDRTVRIHRGGDGPPLVLLHGNPTHAYLWRKTLPALLQRFDCLAVDLVGFGGSSAQHDLGIAGHAQIVASVIGQLIAPAPVTWLGHDWGVATAFNAIAQLPHHRHTLAFTEGHLEWIPSWESTDPGFAALFRPLRQDPAGEQFVVTENRFIEDILLGSLPNLSDDERAAYRSPFTTPSRRYAVLRLLREIPVAGEPVGMAEVLRVVDAGLADPALPKLLLYATPGAVIDEPYRARIADRSANLTMIDIGAAGHFTPEEQPDAIAAAVLNSFA